MNILAIDDSTTNNVLLSSVLETKGYNIHVALNAHEAYNILQNEDIDIILLDLLMPEISGFDFLKEVKKHKAYNNIPVIVISAASSSQNIDRSREMGADDFIEKPVDINLLLDTIDSFKNKS